jgi:O-acetyl-ADP-ribose deacetylase (regulator of RNase III)
MPIEYRIGDLFTTDAQAMAHGCNLTGTMGAGIAKSFRNEYPAMYEIYREICMVGGFTPGTYYAYRAPDGKLIFNLFTQRYPGRDARCEWIESSLTKALNDHANLKSLALPQIGAGLGGLKWEDVQSTLERVASKTDTVLIVYKYGI